jgi:hypothetical protein
MREMKYLKVSADVAKRAGVIDVRYRTGDGDFIINESDLRMIRFEPEEITRGIGGQVISEQEAMLLIEEGGNQLGEEESVVNNEDVIENAGEPIFKPEESIVPEGEETDGKEAEHE